MKRYRFDMPTTRPITVYDSQHAAISHLVQGDGKFSLVCIYLGAGGTLGMHPAVQNQLLLVVAGRGWVKVPDEGPQPIQASQAVFWQAGELHQTGTHSGLTAIVLEGETVTPSEYMEEINDDA